MGVDYNHYVLVGVNIQDKRKMVRTDDRFLPYIEGHQGITMSIVDDRESRNFMYFGKVFADGDKYEGIKHTEIETGTFQKAIQEVADAYKNVFNEEIEESKIKLIACTVIY